MLLTVGGEAALQQRLCLLEHSGGCISRRYVHATCCEHRNLQILQVAPVTDIFHIERPLTCGALGEGEREGILQDTGGVYCDGVMFLEVVIVVLKAHFCVRISSTECA